jgi:hypothetical protein
MLVALALSGTASAATSIGQSPSDYASSGCSNCGGFEVSAFSGTSYTVPSDGVITSYAIRTGSLTPTASDIVHFTVVRPIGGLTYAVILREAAQTFAGRSANKLESFPTRVTVKAGDLIGNQWSTTTVDPLFDAPGPNGVFTSADFATVQTGATITAFNPSIPSSPRLNLVANVEPDADLDGYGDETQDGCIGDGAVHDPCNPVLSGFKFSPNKFTVNNAGKVLSATKAAPGTKISLKLSRAAHVSFVLNLRGTGRKVGKTCAKQTSKNKNKKKCTYYPRSFKLERDLPAGTSNIAFSGRIKVGAKKVALPLGSYVATAYPFSVQSQLGGNTAKTTFKVVAATKKR